jgi:hypothetical protein
VHLHVPPLELTSGRVEGDPTGRPDLDVELIHVSGLAAIHRRAASLLALQAAKKPHAAYKPVETRGNADAHVVFYYVVDLPEARDYYVYGTGGRALVDIIHTECQLAFTGV